VVAVTAAELAWIDGVVAELGSGALTWSYEDFAALGTQLAPGLDIELKLISPAFGEPDPTVTP
jgi:hypothetical protein